jgi:tRNA(fMet)-specific endonuclease VapC
MLSLDTNTVIGILTGRSPRARVCFAKASRDQVTISISSIVLLELWYGCARSAQPERNRATIIEFLDSPVGLMAFDADDARRTGELRAALAKLGTPIGPHDVQIAGQALARGLTLVTDNEREFRRVAGLQVTNWLRP